MKKEIRELNAPAIDLIADILDKHVDAILGEVRIRFKQIKTDQSSEPADPCASLMSDKTACGSENGNCDSQPAKPDEWKLAVDHELTNMQSTADSYPSAKEAVKALIDWHVAVATDPVLRQPAEPVKLDRYDAGYLGGQDGLPAHVWHDIIRSELDRAYDFYMDQLDRAAPQPAKPVKQAEKPDDHVWVKCSVCGTVTHQHFDYCGICCDKVLSRYEPQPAPQPAEPQECGCCGRSDGCDPDCDAVQPAEPVKVPSDLPVTEQEEEAWQQMEKTNE